MFAQHPYASWPWAGGAWAPIPPTPVTIIWSDKWCPAPGPSRTDAVGTLIADLGDGYRYRATRGFNPVQSTWTYSFPFTSAQQLNDMDDFLQQYGERGFYFLPPEELELRFMCVSEWSATITTRAANLELVGELNVTFRRMFNKQPLPSIPA
jgi:phage-related protein